MASSYTSIYDLALTKFDDPILSNTYLENSQDFFEIMHKKLLSAIAEFVQPQATVTKLSDRVEPVFYQELFDGDGTSVSFTLTEITPASTAIVTATVNDIAVSIASVAGNVVTFEEAPSEGADNVKISVYIDGYFNQTLSDREKDILSLLIVKVWAEKERNFLLDIRRLIGDRDFKLISESNSLREKGNWYTAIREEATKKMTALAWSTSIGNRGRR